MVKGGGGDGGRGAESACQIGQQFLWRGVVVDQPGMRNPPAPLAVGLVDSEVERPERSGGKRCGLLYYEREADGFDGNGAECWGEA